MDAKLCIINWNARSISAKKIPLGEFLHRRKIDVALITETHLRPDINFSISGFHFLRLDRRGTTSRGGGVAILVRSGISFTQIPHLNTTVIEEMGIEVHLSFGKLKIVVAYCPMQCKRNYGSAAAFKKDLNIITRSPQKLFVGGDLNERHRAWNNSRKNKYGDLLFNHAEGGHCTVQFPDTPTYISAGGAHSTLDLFLANFAITKPKTLDELTSDHFPVVTEVDFSVYRGPVRHRKDYHNVNWQRFGRLEDSQLQTTYQLSLM